MSAESPSPRTEVTPADADRAPLTQPTLPPAGATSPAAPPGYELGEEVGRGGMGVVYRARDLALDRDVAVKLLRESYPAGGPAARRFLDEARITAQLQHPGVPPVYRVGSLPDGRPFLAMKLIKGQTLDRLLHAEPDRAAQRGRFLAVFEVVCQAVGYAHAHRVIHRDLKPQNVMVGAFGEVQVMDWGLAKVLSVDQKPVPGADAEATYGTEIRSARDTDHETEAGSLLGTPAFMPPEQAIGAVDQIDARSDVFSLGGILCALLTGKPPYVGETVESTRQLAARARLDDALRRLDECGAEPGLVTLCRACLAAEKDDRPSDAGAVAAEVARLRADAERRARDAELAEVRATEGRKRRRVLLAAGAGLLVVLLAGVTGTTVGLVRAQRARQQAEAERDRAAQARDRAAQALDAMTSEVTGESLATQKHLSREQRQFLAGVLDHYRELAREQGNDRESRRRAAAAARRLGLIEARLGNTDQAVAAFQRSRDEFTALAADFPDEPDYRVGLAVSQNDLGSEFRLLGKPAEAEAAFRASLDIHQALLAKSPDDSRLLPNLAAAHTNLGVVLTELRRPAEAEKEFRSAVAGYEKLVAADAGVPTYRLNLAQAQDELGSLLKDQNRYGPAEKAYRAALDLRRKLVEEFPDRPEYRLELSGSQNNLGLLLDDSGRPKEAEKEQLAAVRTRERMVADFPGAPEYRILLGGSYGNVGRLYRKHGRPADGLSWFDKGVATLTRELEREPRHAVARLYLRNTYAGRASALDQLGRHVEAVKDWDRAVELSPRGDVGRVRVSRAVARVQAGQTREAVAEVAELAKSDGWTAGQLYDLACICAVASGKDVAHREAYATRAVELLRRAVARGWTDGAHMAKDPDLEPLRDRPDFQQLVASLRH